MRSVARSVMHNHQQTLYKISFLCILIVPETPSIGRIPGPEGARAFAERDAAKTMTRAFFDPRVQDET